MRSGGRVGFGTSSSNSSSYRMPKKEPTLYKPTLYKDGIVEKDNILSNLKRGALIEITEEYEFIQYFLLQDYANKNNKDKCIFYIKEKENGNIYNVTHTKNTNTINLTNIVINKDSYTFTISRLSCVGDAQSECEEKILGPIKFNDLKSKYTIYRTPIFSNVRKYVLDFRRNDPIKTTWIEKSERKAKNLKIEDNDTEKDDYMFMNRLIIKEINPLPDSEPEYIYSVIRDSSIKMITYVNKGIINEQIGILKSPLLITFLENISIISTHNYLLAFQQKTDKFICYYVYIFNEGTSNTKDDFIAYVHKNIQPDETKRKIETPGIFYSVKPERISIEDLFNNYALVFNKKPLPTIQASQASQGGKHSRRRKTPRRNKRKQTQRRRKRIHM